MTQANNVAIESSQVNSAGVLGVYGGGTGANTGVTDFKNRIINGDFRIYQRYGAINVAVTPTNGQYTLDRWCSNASQAGKYSIQQSTFIPTTTLTFPSGFVYSLQATALSSYSVGTNEFFDQFQPIEGYNIADFNFGTSYARNLVLSFYINSSISGTYGGYVVNGANNRFYPFSYTITANTWTYVQIPITGDTAGTWSTTNGVGMYVVPVSLGCGSGLTTTSNLFTWTSSTNRGATGQVNLVGTNNATLYLEGVQLELATTYSTNFGFRSIQTEIALCQRYYETSYPPGYSVGYNFGETYPWSTSKPMAVNFIASDDNLTSQTWRFKVDKRTSPTVTIYSPNNGSSGYTWTYASGYANNYACGVTYTQKDLFNINQALVAGTNYANESYFHFVANAEL